MTMSWGAAATVNCLLAGSGPDPEDCHRRVAREPLGGDRPVYRRRVPVLRRRTAVREELHDGRRVSYPYGIGQLEVTVRQWVAFLNTANPGGADPHHLYSASESSSAWPKYGQINFTSTAGKGRHYSVASPAWADKPYGFANFLRAARFDNSLHHGRVLAKRTSAAGDFRYVTFRVALSRQTERGMYDLAGARRKGPTPSRATGFVIPSQDEWIKAAHYDRNGGGTYSYWKYPTNAGVFGDGSATAPHPTTLNPSTGDVTNAAYAATGDVPRFRRGGADLVPGVGATRVELHQCQPARTRPNDDDKAFQGSVGTVGQAKTRSPWGTLDQGGNAVEWTDTISPSPTGKSDGRVWRGLHGGIANAGPYQLWLSAVGLQPRTKLFTATYPWLGIRVGVRTIVPGAQSMTLPHKVALGIAGSFVGGLGGHLLLHHGRGFVQLSSWAGSIIGSLIVLTIYMQVQQRRA